MKPTTQSADELREFMNDHFPELAELSAEKKPPPARRKIAVGILAYDARMHCKNAMSLTQAIFEMAKEGWGFSYILREGDSMVARGRNILLSKFMVAPEMQDSTDLVLIDTDLEFKPEDLVKLCKHDVDVVGGAYPYKDDEPNFPLRWPRDGLFEQNGLWSVSAVTPGFMRVTRKALQSMTEEHSHLQFADKAMGDKKAWMLFDNLIRPNGVWDEGYVFCERWRQCGGKVWLDPTLSITHIGLKAYTHGTIAQWLDKKAETFTHLEAEYPNIPPLKLMRKAMGEKIDLEQESKNASDHQHSNPEPPGASENDGREDAAKHLPSGHDADDLGGPGRSTDNRRLEGDDAEPEPADIHQAAGGQSRRKVRSSTNGGAGRHLPAGG